MVATEEEDDACDSISEMYSDEGNDQAGGGEQQQKISKHGGSSDDGDVMDYGRISSINTAISGLQQVRTQSMTASDIKKADR